MDYQARIGITSAPVVVEVASTSGESGSAQGFDLEPGASESVTFPAAEDLTYEVRVDGTVIAEGGWEAPDDCLVEVPISSLSDCDSLTIEVTNPLEDEAIEVIFASGDLTQTLTIAPGETGEVTFTNVQSATVTIGDDIQEIPWVRPADCDGGGGGLPVTGAPTGVAIGAALALLAVGGGLFLLARRRRVTFTA